MKNNIKSVIKTMFFVVLAVITTSCDLEVKEKFVFDDEVDPLYTFGSMTAWEWIQSQASKPVVPPATAPEFSYMKQAIEITGLQSTYNSMPGTLFLLKDIAWTKPKIGTANAGIMLTEFPLSGGSLTHPSVNKDKLRNILLYHMINEYIDQGPTGLLTAEKDYVFNTLYKNVNVNILTIRRDRTYNLQLNSNSVLIPAITRRPASVRLHNYIFNNGKTLVHIIEDYIKNEDFKSVP